MNALVAGGTNFIGRTIATELSRHNAVTVLNRGSAAPLVAAKHHAIADRTDVTAVRAALEPSGPFDVVVDVSATEPAHVRGLLEGLGDERPDTYVLISSAAVYSPEAPSPRIEDSATSGDPVWGGYGESKAECERILRDSFIGELSVLRPPYVYGPGNNEDREKWLWSRLVHERPVYVPSDGQSRIQFCHVSHLAAVVTAVIKRSIPPGTYNVGEARTYTFDEYLALLAEVSGREGQFVHTGDTNAPARSYFPFRDIDLVLSVEKLRLSGMQLRPDLRTGLRETWEWLGAHGLPRYEPTPQETAWCRE